MAKKKAKKKATKKKANPVGRPTKYKPEYPEMLEEHMASGLSFESFAGLVSVDRETIYTWTEKHPKFLDAKKTGIEKGRLFYERIGIEGMWKQKDYDDDGNIISDRQLNTTNWIFQMKNRYDWRDKTEVSTEEEKPFVIAYKTKSERKEEE